MTIYATPFEARTLETTGPSVDSGFETLEAVIEAMGDDYVHRGPAIVIYGDDDNRVQFTRLPYRID